MIVFTLIIANVTGHNEDVEVLLLKVEELGHPAAQTSVDERHETHKVVVHCALLTVDHLGLVLHGPLVGARYNGNQKVQHDDNHHIDLHYPEDPHESYDNLGLNRVLIVEHVLPEEVLWRCQVSNTIAERLNRNQH